MALKKWIVLLIIKEKSNWNEKKRKICFFSSDLKNSKEIQFPNISDAIHELGKIFKTKI